jgi:molybdopterin-containing oxidoreductase family iron-sulfur binding subunit
MKAGSVHTLLMSGVNPVYTLADSASFVAGLKKLLLQLLCLLRKMRLRYADNSGSVPHYLETWGDLSLTKGTYSLTQPTIRPV